MSLWQSLVVLMDDLVMSAWHSPLFLTSQSLSLCVDGCSDDVIVTFTCFSLLRKKTSPTVKELLKQHTASTATPSTFNGGLDNLIPASSPPNPQGDKSTVQDKTELVVSEVLQDGDERKTNGAEFGQNQLPPDLPADLAATIVGIKQVTYTPMFCIVFLPVAVDRLIPYCVCICFCDAQEKPGSSFSDMGCLDSFCLFSVVAHNVNYLRWIII